MVIQQLSGWYEEPRGVWQDYAACFGEDPDLFFPGRHDAEAKYPIARKICARCPVQEECLEYALENRMDAGMWGGMNAHELRKERKRRLKEKRDREQDDG